MNLNKRAFTLVELLVTMGIMAILMTALTTSVAAAKQRAKIQKTIAEVKTISQAILVYENYNKGYQLPELNKVEATSSAIGFLLGSDSTPALLMAQLNASGKLTDPWYKTYRITIRKGRISIVRPTATGSMRTGYSMSNLYPLTGDERQ